MNKIEETLYEIAGREIAERRTVPGVMAKAFADAQGDEKRTIANYLRLRVRQLSDQAKAEAAKQTQFARVNGARDREERQREKKAAKRAHQQKLWDEHQERLRLYHAKDQARKAKGRPHPFLIFTIIIGMLLILQLILSVLFGTL